MSENRKMISIVIPSRNEEKYIGACLQSIVDLNFNLNLLTVFVCDGLSTDKTLEIIYEYSSKYSFIHYIENSKKTTPHALNIGIKHSQDFEYIMILGAHSKLTTNYLNYIFSIFEQNPDVHCVGGFLNNIYESKISEYIGKVMSSPVGVGNAYFRTGIKSGYVDTVAFGVYKKEVFDKIGMFDEELVRNQDDEFNYRMIKNNLKIYLNTDCIINYYVRSSFSKLFRQYYQYGLWKVYVNLKHHTVTTIRQTIPFIFVLYILVILLHFLIFYKLNFYLVSPLIAYFILILSTTIHLSRNLKSFSGIFISFVLIHIGYGFGYLNGIIKFLILRNKIKNDESLTR